MLSLIFRTSVKETLLLVLWCRVLPVSVYVVMVTLQRYHLFVWTVFSPKLLYEGMYSLVTVILLSILMIFA